MTKFVLKFRKLSQLNDVFFFLFTFEDAQALSWLNKYLYKSFQEYPHVLRGNLWYHVQPCICPSPSRFISPVKPRFKPLFLLFLATYLKIWLVNFHSNRQLHAENELYILSVFLRLSVFNCHTYNAFHGVYTESGCLRFVLKILCVFMC